MSGWIDENRKKFTWKYETELNPWRPIETAPKDASILTWSERDGINATRWSTYIPAGTDGGLWIIDIKDTDYIILEPTHWMPLPEPPK